MVEVAEMRVDDAVPMVRAPATSESPEPVRLVKEDDPSSNAPPEMVSPFEDARPAVVIPPVKLEVAFDASRIEPPVTVNPLFDAKLEARIPPAKVEVALLPRMVVVAVEPT